MQYDPSLTHSYPTIIVNNFTLAQYIMILYCTRLEYNPILAWEKKNYGQLCLSGPQLTGIPVTVYFALWTIFPETDNPPTVD